MAENPFGIGQPVRRKEDVRLLTGAGNYTDDTRLPGQLYGYFVRSPHAHASVDAIDVSAAEKMQGVIAVLTATDYFADELGPLPHVPNPAHITRPKTPAFENADGSKVFQGEHFPLAQDKVRHVGEPVAIVLAETEAQAIDAAECVEVQYTPLAAVTDVKRAITASAPQIWEDAPGNVCFDSELGDPGAVEAAFADASQIVAMTLSNNRVTAVSMEPRSAIGKYFPDRDHYTLISGSQGSHRIKDPLVALLGCEADQVRVVCDDVGGGFGMRNWLFPELALVAWAAKRSGQPVRWVSTRSEAFLSDMQARDLVTTAELALDEAGKFLAIRLDHLGNIGAHTMSFVPLANGVRLVTSIYDIPAAYVRVRGVLTNTLPTGPYRGAGRPEAMFNIERLIDEAATQIGMDRIDLRRRNLIPQEKLPYENPVELTYECGAFAENMEASLALADWNGFARRRKKAASGGLLRGIGLSNYVETPVGFPREVCDISIEPKGRVTVAVGTQSHGQGHETSFAQVIAEELGVPFDQIDIIFGDTDVVPDGGGTHSNRSMRIAGTLMVQGCQTIIRRGKALAAEFLEAAEDDIDYSAGLFFVTGTDRNISLFSLAEKARNSGDSFIAEERFQGRIPAYPTGCAVAEVEIDPETGTVRVCSWTAIDDVGRVINPMIVEGQTHGGIAQGIGQALLEDIAYDDETGQLTGGSFLDYCMPRADDLPFFTTETVNNAPTQGNPLGVKGGGEGGTTPAPAALINAIVDALRPVGVNDLEMPTTPLRVWQAIQDAKRDRPLNRN
ncbi:MAG: xanthine dehydrogenase [Rhodospirillaceae bacterium]|nr:xanthine dehydrogenase [Rhodospirillaceae bacterium]|tara:strand:+ start:22286 stop:24643 length:2358 start_codon:yes stop_codon:yes gene_type:complete